MKKNKNQLLPNENSFDDSDACSFAFGIQAYAAYVLSAHRSVPIDVYGYTQSGQLAIIIFVIFYLDHWWQSCNDEMSRNFCDGKLTTQGFR